MPTNDKEYARKYARMCRWLYRLENPRKQAGTKLGTKFPIRVKKSTEPIKKYDWDRT